MSVEPWKLAWLLAGAIFVIAKVAMLAWDRPRARRAAIAAWLLAWPGMSPRRELRRRSGDAGPGAVTLGLAWMALGLGGLASASMLATRPIVAGSLAAVSIVLVLHFGAFRVLHAAWRAAGRDVRPVMDAPGMTPSLSELWGRRWNAPFSELAARVVGRPLRPVLGRSGAILAVFLASGLVHELVLTLPAGGGWGGPTAYFLIQGAGVLFEATPRARRAGLGSGGTPSRAFALAVALLPLPLLLGPAVLTRIALPLAQSLFPEAALMTIESLLGLALWLSVLAHACVLMAGVQVPRRLRWSEELPRLSRFNRNLVRVYHVFVGFVVVAFGALTAALHEEMMRGDRAAVAIALVIGIFWLGRLIVDLVVYRHEDWPRGRAFVAGHALLVVAFAGMAGSSLGVVLRSWAG